MDTLGKHLLVEYHDIPAAVLNDVEKIETLMVAAAEAAGATVVNSVFHRFAPQGVSGVVVIEESHLSVHTWPERGYAALDFYTCGACKPEAANDYLVAHLQPSRVDSMHVQRGLSLGDAGAHNAAIKPGPVETSRSTSKGA